jgi:hypothetical protein
METMRRTLRELRQSLPNERVISDVDDTEDDEDSDASDDDSGGGGRREVGASVLASRK